MPYDGNGNYTLPPVYKATPGTEIITTQHNTPLEDIQAALNAVLLRNGSAPITGNWNMGTNRITFLADGVANADAANVGQLKALLNNTALTGVTTVPPVTDWTAYQPVGAKDADARYAILNQNNAGSLSITGSFTALVASSTQKVTFRRASTYGGINSYDGSNWHPLMINDDDTASTAKGTLAFSDVAQTFTKTQTFSGQTLVQDVDTFDGKDALNAETAERRYIKSVPATGQTRITSLVENADGRAVFDDGTNSPVLANLTDLPLSDASLKIQMFRATVTFSGAEVTVTFPKAFKPGTKPYVFFPSYQEIGGAQWYSFVGICGDGTGDTAITNTQFRIFKVGWSGSSFGSNTGTIILDVIAAGYYA